MAHQYQPEGQHHHQQHHHHHSKRSRIKMLPLILVGLIAASAYWMSLTNSDPNVAPKDAPVGEMHAAPADQNQASAMQPVGPGAATTGDDATASRGGQDATR